MSPDEMLSIYKDIFSDSFIGVPEFIKGRKCIVMTEESPDTKLAKMEVRGVPENSILVKIQKYPSPDKIFKSERGECKRCDYILLTPYKSDLYIIFIEMKSKSVNKPDIICQFKGAVCFMAYCDAIAEKFHKARISSSPKERYVVFMANRHNKMATSPKPIETEHSSPERAMYFPIGSRKTKESFVFLRELI